SGVVVATTGIRHLAWKPNLVAMFRDRYSRGEEIASLWRLYVRKDMRERGLGRWLTTLCETEAARLGYGTMYLHASSDAPGTLAFWQPVGSRFTGPYDPSTHFDKPIGTDVIGGSAVRVG